MLGGLIGLYLLTVTLGPRLMESVRMDMGLRDGMTDTLDWMMLLYYPGAAALTAPLGALLGKRRPNAVAAAALGVLLAGAALSGLAGDPGQLLTGRVVSGLGAGALLAGASCSSGATARCGRPDPPPGSARSPPCSEPCSAGR
ncbi:hypothetical protein BJF79_12045 [Actinomadura sp. CNU-125]|uniref:hypothetical protein n=1 Tax=Actinomadura sp. CNU-125 TaxID=1904961 RepID=UPI00095B987C|nr:hypothetical protein [Actinomadura sp. CNU-125]OLT26435.1 hypothetical protein BJF79_12045 [Actinomadura sp. CNU-125]